MVSTGKRVLIVEDERHNRQILREVVEEIGGYCAVTATGGVEGLELARSERPDLILLDLRMPDMDGFTLTRTLKGDPFTRRIPILAISGLTHPRDREEALAAGAQAYIDKPFDLDHLIDEIRRLAEADGTSAEPA